MENELNFIQSPIYTRMATPLPQGEIVYLYQGICLFHRNINNVKRLSHKTINIDSIVIR